MARILLAIPPMTQLNTPYPSTAYLKGWLGSLGHEVRQVDFSLEVALRLFSAQSLRRLKEKISGKSKNDVVRFFWEAGDDYISVVDSVIQFLQGRDAALANRIVSLQFLPQGPKMMQALENFNALKESGVDAKTLFFGTLGVQDLAKFYASLFIDDITEFYKNIDDPDFNLSRYGERLAASQPDFHFIENKLKKNTLVSHALEEIARKAMEDFKPDFLACTVPFPGNVLGAFQMAKLAKSEFPQIKTILGGGYVNTELRELTEKKIFQYFDYLTLDDGEAPFVEILKDSKKLKRTFVLENEQVVFKDLSEAHDIPQKNLPAPDYSDLDPNRYLSLLEMPNPMHRLWSDGFWNKLTLAHGCYWKKCSFCDVNLDYIGRYEPSPAEKIVDRMEAVMAQTHRSGFHFVDEAAPPALLKQMAQEIKRRKLNVTWWGNVRFDKAFDEMTCQLLAESGCIAMTGGLEVASDRLLKLMNKGVSVEQVAKVTRNMRKAGILVHAYLMYGFPTQTEQETIDALDAVRKLFLFDCLTSAYWHRFSATAHSPVGRNPEAYHIELIPMPRSTFAKNDLEFHDPKGCDHDRFAPGLKKALYNYMLGLGLEEPLQFWFDFSVPRPQSYLIETLM